MSLEDRKTLLDGLRLVAHAADTATDGDLLLLWRVYNHLHFQLDGSVVTIPTAAKSLFKYEPRLQMVVAG